MYTIKRLGIESLDAILALEESCFPAPDRWKLADWKELLEDERAVYYAMTDGEKLIGDVFIYNWKGEYDYVKIMNVSVHPDYRNQGVASQLLPARISDIADCAENLIEAILDNIE